MQAKQLLLIATGVSAFFSLLFVVWCLVGEAQSSLLGATATFKYLDLVDGDGIDNGGVYLIGLLLGGVALLTALVAVFMVFKGKWKPSVICVAVALLLQVGAVICAMMPAELTAINGLKLNMDFTWGPAMAWVANVCFIVDLVLLKVKKPDLVGSSGTGAAV